MMRRALILLGVLLPLLTQADNAKIELEVTRIKGNKELPQILYIVPWKDFENSQSKSQKLHLHDFFGELYKPLLPRRHPKPTPTKD